MLLMLTLVSALHAGSASDSVAGAWHFKNEVSGVNWEETCTIKQAASTLTGTCVSQQGQSFEVTGELKDGKATFKHGGEYEGKEIVIAFSVDQASATELKGTIQVSPLDASGTFTAAPVPPKP